MVTKEQAAKLRNFGVHSAHIREMDTEVIDAVINLNRAGFTTTQSCAGHKGMPGGYEKGMMCIYPFPKKEDLKTAISIMKKSGLKKIKVVKTSASHLEYLEFEGMGKTYSSRKQTNH
jgi:hypothetical protein